jgi:hypothetical protein
VLNDIFTTFHAEDRQKLLHVRSALAQPVLQLAPCVRSRGGERARLRGCRKARGTRCTRRTSRSSSTTPTTASRRAARGHAPLRPALPRLRSAAGRVSPCVASSRPGAPSLLGCWPCQPLRSSSIPESRGDTEDVCCRWTGRRCVCGGRSGSRRTSTTWTRSTSRAPPCSLALAGRRPLVHGRQHAGALGQKLPERWGAICMQATAFVLQAPHFGWRNERQLAYGLLPRAGRPR